MIRKDSSSYSTLSFAIYQDSKLYKNKLIEQHNFLPLLFNHTDETIYSEAKIKINMVKYNLTFINHGITSLIVVFGSFVITKKGNYRRTLLSFALPTRKKKPKELLNYFHLPSDMLLIRIILSNHYLTCVISKSIHNIHEMVNVVL